MSDRITRRRYVFALGTAGAVGLAGCAEFESGSEEGGDEGSDEEATDTEQTGTSDGSESDGSATASAEAEATLRQYLEAYADGDEATVESLTHPESPLGTETEQFELTINGIAPWSLSERAANLNREITDGELADAREALESDVDRIGAEEYATLRLDIEVDGERDNTVALLVRDDGQWYVYGLSVDGYLYGAADHGDQEDTGTEQTVNRLEVVSTVGTDINDGTIGRVEMVVKRAPGAGDIDLSTTTVQFVHSSGSTDLTFGSTGGSGSATEFGVRPIQDENESLQGDAPTLDDPADRAQILLDTGSIVPSTDGLREGDTATVQFTTQSGGTTEARLVVPETLSGSEAVAL